MFSTMVLYCRGIPSSTVDNVQYCGGLLSGLWGHAIRTMEDLSTVDGWISTVKGYHKLCGWGNTSALWGHFSAVENVFTVLNTNFCTILVHGRLLTF